MQRIGFVVFDGFQSMGFAALSVFEYANVLLDKPRYEMHFLSEKGGLVRSSTGMVVGSEPFGAVTYDTVIVGGERRFWKMHLRRCLPSCAEH